MASTSCIFQEDAHKVEMEDELHGLQLSRRDADEAAVAGAACAIFATCEAAVESCRTGRVVEVGQS